MKYRQKFEPYIQEEINEELTKNYNTINIHYKDGTYDEVIDLSETNCSYNYNNKLHIRTRHDAIMHRYNRNLNW